LTERKLAARLEELGDEILRRSADEARPGLVPLINATGVIVHTNLGRAMIGPEAMKRIVAVCDEFVNLEYEIDTGRRGKRNDRLSHLFETVFPGHGFHIVNNNAAAVLLVLNTFAEGREVVVSRGELVEIGGSFRLPDILAKSGARLREVGTTNRTRVADFTGAIGTATGMLMRVHTSNYRIVGFTEAAPLAELAAVAKKHDIPLVVDEGAGNLHDLSEYGITGEPTVAELLAAGADLVTFSGDKLLGGPQAGIVVGRPDLIERIRTNPMSRALRVGKLTLAALEATLVSHRRGSHVRDLPVQGMIATPLQGLQPRVEALADAINKECGADLSVEMRPGESVIGGGAAPDTGLPTLLIALMPKDRSVSRLARDLRAADPPIITRAGDDALLVDLRTVPPGREDFIAAALGLLYRKTKRPKKVRR
jgi:L-seryl-tRNA(Ser) seleniumtransferase